MEFRVAQAALISRRVTVVENQGDVFSSVETLAGHCAFLSRQLQLLEEARAFVIKRNEQELAVLIPLLYAVVETSASVLALARHEKMRDAFVLSRTAFETIVNACFICAKGEETADKAWRHTWQKSHRDLSRELETNGRLLSLKWRGEISTEGNARLQAALAEWTGRKDREITSWTPETASEKVEAIGSRYGAKIGISLQFALFSVYRHASEISHGTLFGALFALGLTSPPGPPESPERLAAHQRGYTSMVVMMLGLAMAALTRVLAVEVPELANLADAAENEIRQLGFLPWARERRKAD